MKRTIVTCAAIFALTLTGCAQDDQDRFDSLTTKSYTGNATEDLRTLCSIGSFINGMNNTADAHVQDTALDLAGEYGQSDDPDVATALEGIQLLVSADQGVREEGERLIDDACDSF